MCGIAGILNLNSKQVEEESIISMLSSIYHRGPDESGVYFGNGIGLGNVRLSIIDLESGQQPMIDESGNYVIVYNGELYNYIELREALLEKGYKFKTSSDTEVVLNMFIHYGAECLSHFNGQFAFAIWNKKKEGIISCTRQGWDKASFLYQSKWKFIVLF
jgi:asparagine synthase (glutamine-hydrolysing)